MRARDRRERERLIQKILAEGLPDDDEDENEDSAPEDERPMADSPPFAFADPHADDHTRPGDCGCSAAHHDRRFNDR